MPNPLPSEVLKNYPDVYGHTIKRERKQKVVIKGIPLEIKIYKTTLKTGGIRLSLVDNSTPLILKFLEYLASIESQRPADERALGMWSFTTLSSLDSGLEKFEGAGFYVYQNHVIFTEEEKAASPMDRLVTWVEYYKKKFNIKTSIKEEEFSELDELERSREE